VFPDPDYPIFDYLYIEIGEKIFFRFAVRSVVTRAISCKTDVIFLFPTPDYPIFDYLYVEIGEKIFFRSAFRIPYLAHRLANLENFSRFGFADLDYPFL